MKADGACSMDGQTALDLILEDYDENEYEVVEAYVEDGHAKHDATNYYSIFLRKLDNTYWKVNFIRSYNYGLDEDSVYASQVIKKEVTKTVWMHL